MEILNEQTRIPHVKREERKEKVGNTCRHLILDTSAVDKVR